MNYGEFITGSMPIHRGLRMIEVEPEEIRDRYNGMRPIIQFEEKIIFDWYGWRTTVEEGAISDGSSDPWFIPYFSQTDREMDAVGGIHDMGYRCCVALSAKLDMTLEEFRLFMDQMYHDAGIANGNSKWLMWIRYKGVRWFANKRFKWYAENPTNPDGLISIEEAP